jgi:hypothetical protein
MNNVLSVDDIIVTLNHSAFPSLIIEGKDDILVFRRLEQNVSIRGFTILPAGGRSAVLELFRRRNEIRNQDGVFFFADRDLWLFDVVPAEYRHDRLMFTVGYSIENDMYIDGELEALLTPAEQIRFTEDIETYLAYYCRVVSGYLSGQGDNGLADHPNMVLDNPAELNLRCEALGGIAVSAEIASTIRTNYFTHLRGKTLFQIILRQLSKGGRNPKYSKAALFDLGAVRNGPSMRRVLEWVESAFAQS